MADHEAALAAVRFDGYALRYAAEESRADREIVLAAVRQYGWALMWAAEPLKADREIVLAAVQQEGSALHCAAEQLKADREIVLAAVQQDGSALEWAAEPLTADREIVLAAVRQDGSALEYAAEQLNADREFMLAAVQQNGDALKYAAEELKADREIVLAAVQQDGLALKYAAEQLNADRELWLAAVQQNGDALKYAAEELKADREIVLAAVQQNGDALKYAAEQLKADREIVLAAVQQDGSALEIAAKPLRADREIVLAAVQQDGSALEIAAKPLRADREIVLAAVQQDGSALEIAAKPLRADREIVLAAVQQDGSALEIAAKPLRADREIVLAAVRQDGEALESAAKPLRADREIVLAAVQQDGSALEIAAKPLRADREIVLAAVRQDGEALESAARRLKADNGFVLEASRLNSEAHEAAARLLGADALRELEASAQNHFRVKLVFLGHGGAGKTCLRRRLAEDVFADQLPATDGIEMSELEDGSETQDLRLSVYLWDLGGQDEYMSTHPFFIDGFALYALVVDLERYVRSNGDNVASSLRFLRTARARAPVAPIALIGTHADSAEVTEPSGVIRQLQRELDNACPGGITPTLVFVVSSKDGTGVDSLRAELAAHAVTLDHVQDTVPAPTVKLHEELRSRAADSPHLPLRQVVSLATSDACRVTVAGKPPATIPDESSALRALKKLSGWGAIHYRDSPMLRETVVLRPQWLADAMACIIGPKQAAAESAGAITRARAQQRCALLANGRLEHARIDELWSAETIDGFDVSNVALRPYLLATMHAFELAYPLLDAEGKPTGASLVPSMLPSLRPSGAAPFAGLVPDSLVAKMEIRLSFLPPELFPRLIVRLQQYVKAGDCWFDARALSSGGMLLARGEGAGISRAAITMGGCFDAAGGWFTSAAFATSIIIDARGAHPTALRGLAWRCLKTLQTEYDGVKAAVSLLSSAGNAVDLEDARETIREDREVRSRGEVLLVDDLKPGALVTGARDADERRFDGDLATAPPGPGNWRARTVAFFESTYLPADMHGRSAPPLLWLLVPTEAAVEDGSWLDHSQWAPATFELRALSEPPEEEWGWALTTLRVPFDVTSQALVHATPYLLRMLRVVLRVGVRDLAAAVARDLGRLVSAVEAKAAIIVGDAADEQPPPAQRRRLEGPSQADARPVLTPKAPYLDWRALGDAALAASADGGMLIVPDPSRTRAVWMARQHLPASLRAMMLQNDHLQNELARLRNLELTYPSTWLLGADGSPQQGLIEVPASSTEYAEVAQRLLSKLPEATVLGVKRVQNEGLYRRFWQERKEKESLLGDPNERRLWMSSGDTQPDVLCNSRYGFDPTYYLRGGKYGSYGAAVYFAYEPLYSHFFRECTAPPPLEGSQLILAQVVLGEVKDFGAAYGQMVDGRQQIRNLEREPVKPDGGHYDSWCGTEGDLKWVREDKAKCERHMTGRTPATCDACERVKAHCRVLKADGKRYGKQYMIARSEKAYPEYVLRYTLP